MSAGKLVVITGALGAHGQELVRAYARLGARLLLTDRPATCPGIEGVPPEAFQYFPCDLGDAQQLAQLAPRLLEAGAPDVLINNAAVFPFIDLMDMPLDAIDTLLAVNLRAPLYLCQTLGAAMASAGRGAICNVSSGAASVVRENGAVYGASKAALEQLTRAFAVRLGPSGVRVNAVRPGLRTANTVQAIPDAHQERIREGIPLRRFSQEGEFADTVLFLCSDQAAFITGQTIAVDGGSAINRRR